MEDFTEEILDGKIDKNPYRKNNITPCMYCSYHSICGFDDREFNNQCKNLIKVSSVEDVMRELGGDICEEEQHEMDRGTE